MVSSGCVEKVEKHEKARTSCILGRFDVLARYNAAMSDKRSVTYWTPTIIDTCRACPDFKDYGTYRICGLNIGIRNAQGPRRDSGLVPFIYTRN